MTDATGAFAFRRLPPARYELRVVAPEGWSFTSPSSFVIDLRQDEHFEIGVAIVRRDEKVLGSDSTRFATGSGGRVVVQGSGAAGATLVVEDLDSIPGVDKDGFFGGVKVSLSGGSAVTTPSGASASSMRGGSFKRCVNEERRYSLPG
jgi:hypothetical protein